MASASLYLNNIPITDENVCYVISYILKAEFIYKPSIGDLNGFIHLYIKYAIGNLKRSYNKTKKEIPISVLSKDRLEKVFDTPAKYEQPKESELFSHIKASKVLNPQQEEVIYSIFFLQEKEKDIADRLGLSSKRINFIKHKALKKLKCLKSELI